MTKQENRKLREVDEASSVKVKKDGFMCFMLRWESATTGEWYTSVNVVSPNGRKLSDDISKEPCTEESALRQIELAKAFVATEGLNWRVDDGD